MFRWECGGCVFWFFCGFFFKVTTKMFQKFTATN